MPAQSSYGPNGTSSPSFLKRKFLSLSSKSRGDPSYPRRFASDPPSRAAWRPSHGSAPPPLGDVDETTQQMGALSFVPEPIKRAYGYVKEKLTSKSPLDLLPKSWRDYIALYRDVSGTSARSLLTPQPNSRS